MPATFPPEFVWRNVNQVAPFAYFAFFSRLGRALQGETGVVSSWWRDRETNSIHGGQEFSQHLLALAVDLELGNPDRVLAKLRDEGLIVLDEGDHIHAQLFPPGVVAPLVRSLGLA